MTVDRTIITDPNGEQVLNFSTNNDQGEISGINNGANVVTILETQPNSGIFKTTDDNHS